MGGFASKPQTDDAEPGDIALDSWVRYDDKETKAFKLNVERQNGRAAMLGITGCLIHELLGVDALYPTGGLGGAAPPTIVAAVGGKTRSGEVQMFSEGDIGVLPPLGVYDPLGLIETRDMRRYEIMEIKHGRAAMLGFLHVIAIEAGVRLPGYLSVSQDLKFSDVPAGGRHWLCVQAADRRRRARRHRARLLGALRRPRGADLQAQRGAPERPRGYAWRRRVVRSRSQPS